MSVILYMGLAFLACLLLMPLFISFMRVKQLGQTTREEGPSWHESKTGTPTMGGLVFIVVSLLVLLLLIYNSQGVRSELWVFWLSLFFFALIGFLDDFISIFRKQNEGLTSRQKFLAQLACSLIISLLAWSADFDFFTFNSWPQVILIVFAVIWLTGFSNAVNLTDGLDGLAGGTNIIAYASYAYLAFNDGKAELGYAALIVVASLLAFLIFNRKPAKIFMGDVGSLALGAGLASLSLALNRPFSLLLIGLVFVLETASVILQVTYFKRTGKRIFKMSPLHHHFELSGWSESKVTLVFWLVGAIASLVYILLFK